MKAAAYKPYEPLGVLKPVADDVWLVDGPEIRFRYGLLRIPFPTRMTVVRLPSGSLWVHSPIAPDEHLVEQLVQLGPIAHFVAPNTIHYWWMKNWSARFPEADVWAVARLARGARQRMPPHHQLGGEPPPAWNGVIDQVIVEGSVLMEAEFFHRPSRTLIITDLIENFEDSRFRSVFYKWLSHIGGVIDPDGKAPFDLRMSFRANRRQLRAAVEQMIAWDSERIIMAHGRWYPHNGAAELRRAFRWVL
jgi:hypothetical protein